MDSTIEYLRSKLSEQWNQDTTKAFEYGENDEFTIGPEQYQDVIDSIKTIK